MDVIGYILIILTFVIFFSLCGWCCKRKREGVVYGFAPTTQVTISQQPVHTSSPVSQPPYPVDPNHPMPNAGAPPPGFHPSTSATPYPPQPVPGGIHAGPTPYPPTAAPYPPTAAPYPPVAYPPATPSMAPYPPPANVTDHQQLPPSYDSVVGQGGSRAPLVQEGYVKQAPYNPHFKG